MKSNFWSELQTQLQVIPLKKYSYNQQNQIPNTITLPFLITQANATSKCPTSKIKCNNQESKFKKDNQTSNPLNYKKTR